jgi:hypothetical protein
MRGFGMPSASKVDLKYHFYVRYKDGSSFVQNSDDVSKIDPKRSAYYDVDQDNVELFQLTGGEGPFCVRLSTGQFYVGADPIASFTVGDPGPKPYKLIFYRQHTHNFNIGLDEISHTVKYCIGYADADGVEHKIYID